MRIGRRVRAALPFPGRRGLRVLAAGMLALVCSYSFAESPGELERYVSLPDSSYEWRQVGSGRIGSTELATLVLTSQTWRGIPWKHQLFIFRPANGLETSSNQAFLFIHGGRWRPEHETGGPDELPREAHIFVRLAETLRSPVAVLRHVPFQPLFERREDALIAYSFDHYLKTGEADWPLLLPMVKSAVRGMDAVQEFARERWRLPIERFTVSGASKRGWTSWLTAAVDARVASVAPMVIDMLNMPAQIELQRATFGELSEEVSDYTQIDLPGRIDSQRGRQLLSIVDPYSYRERLTQPKLILLGTNDRYWPLDALKLYWGGLPEPKHVLYVPNQGHGLKDVGRLIASLAALHRYSARGETLPDIAWEFRRDGGHLQVTLATERKPRRVVAWTANSPTRDFREARWVSRRCERRKDSHVCREPIRQDGYTALYAEVVFDEGKEPDFSLSTAVCIAGGSDEKMERC